MSISDFEKILQSSLRVQKASKVLSQKAYVSQEYIPEIDARSYIKKLVKFQIEPKALLDDMPEPLEEIYRKILNKINLKDYAKRILICLAKKSPLGVLQREVCRIAFLNMIKAKSFFSEITSNNKALRFLSFLLENVERLNDLQTLITGYDFSNPIKIGRSAEDLLHELFDSVDEEEFCRNISKVFTEFVTFLADIDIDKILDVSLEPPLNVLPDVLDLIEVTDNLDEIKKATIKIHEEFFSELFVEVIKTLDEVACSDGLNLYATPELERFKAKSREGEFLHRLMSDITSEYGREDVCKFLRGVPSSTTEKLPLNFHKTTREIYSELPYDYCSNFDTSDSFKGMCGRDAENRLEIRKALRAFREESFDCPKEIGELIGNQNLSALSDFLEQQVKTLTQTLKFAYNSKFLVLQSGTKEGKDKPNLQNFYETKEVKQDEETTKKLKKFLGNKRFLTKPYTQLYRENFVPTLEIDVLNGIGYKNSMKFPSNVNGFILDKQRNLSSIGSVDFATGEYQKSGELPNGFLLGFEPKCKKFELSLKGAKGDFSHFSTNGEIVVDLIELDDLFVVRVKGDKEEQVPSKPLNISKEDWKLLSTLSDNDKNIFANLLNAALKNRGVELLLPDVHSHFVTPTTSTFKSLPKDELTIIYQNIFRNYFDIVRKSELAGTTNLGQKTVQNVSKLPLGFDSICKKRELLSFEDALEILPKDSCLQTGEVDRLTLKIKSFLKFGALSYILSSPFSFSSRTPQRELYELVASSYVDSISTLSEDIKAEFKDNCKVYKELFIDYCFSVHSQFMKNLNVSPYNFLPRVIKEENSWFYKSGESINSPWVVNNKHHNFPFFLGSEMQVYEKKKPTNLSEYGALPQIAGLSLGSTEIKEKLMKNPPKVDNFAEFYGFRLLSSIYFHSPLEFFSDGNKNSLFNDFWRAKYPNNREKSEFELLTQTYITKVKYDGRYSYSNGIKGSDGSSIVSTKIVIEAIYESNSSKTIGEVKSFKVNTDLGTFKTIQELQNAKTKTPQGDFPVFGNGFSTLTSFLGLDGHYNEFKKTRTRGLRETRQNTINFLKTKKFQSNTIVLPLVTRELALNISETSQLIEEQPELKENYEVSEDVLEMKSGNWVCSTKKVLKERITPSQRLWVLDVEKCYTKAFEDLQETSIFKEIQDNFNDGLLFSFVVLDEGIFHSNTLNLKQVYYDFLEKLKGTLDFEKDTPAFSFDVSEILRSAPFLILKGLVETFDPNISVASVIRNLAESGVETGLELFDQEVDINTPLLPYSLALLPLGLFPTPFGVVHLGVDLIEDFLTPNEESNLFNSEFPIVNPENCND